MTAPRKKHFLVSFLGTLFYIMVVIGWLWAILPYVPGLARLSSSLQQPAAPTEPAQQVLVSTHASPLLVISVVIITLILVVVTIYILIKVPKAVSGTGEKLTKKSSELIMPIVTHHAPISTKKHRQLTARITFYVKLVAVVVSVVAASLSFLVTEDVSYDIVILVSTTLAVTALILLSLQIIAAKWLHVSLDSF